MKIKMQCIWGKNDIYWTNCVKILTFLFHINNFFPSRTQSTFGNMIK